jgi:type II secretory pathway pseudopilin PulG
MIAVRRTGDQVSARPARAGGFTLFELVVVVIVAGVMATVLIERLLAYQEYFEKTAMENTLQNMRSGLRNRVSEFIMKDRIREAHSVLQENPITWLEQPPPNYQGALNKPALDQIKPGHWYFDAVQQELVYLPNHRQFLKQATAGDYAIRFRVTEKSMQDGAPSLERFVLTPLTAYKWDWPK